MVWKGKEWRHRYTEKNEKRNKTTPKKKREWVAEPVKPETLFSVAFFQSFFSLFCFFCFDFDKIAIHACWCIKAQNSQANTNTHIRMVGRSNKNNSIVEKEHRHCQTQTTHENSIRKRNDERSLNFSMLEFVYLRRHEQQREWDRECLPVLIENEGNFVCVRASL